VDDDARIRRALHRTDQPVTTDGVLERVRRKKRRYRLARRFQAAGLTVGVVAATVAGAYGLTTLFDSEDVRPVGPGPSTTEGRTACPGDIPFQPSYLPQGFGREPVEGPAPGAPPALTGQTVIHFRDQHGGAIEIRRPATPLLGVEEGQEPPSFPVLGLETAEPVQGEGGGYAVHFRDPNGEARDPCATYSVEAYRVEREELVAVADMLRRDVGGEAFETCPADGSLRPGPDASTEATEAAVAFVEAVREGEGVRAQLLTDPAGWPLVPLGTQLAGDPVTVLGDGPAANSPEVQGCGEAIAGRSWQVTVDDGTDSASLDVQLLLIRRSDGWKVWDLY
jgi:hypothetical protein